MKIITIIISILIAELAGIVGSIFTVNSVKGWYRNLAKPAWNPPSWVFGPVWTTLYALMGIAAALVWSHKDLPGVWAALVLYGVQLLLNVFWTILFFGLKNFKLAYMEIIVLLVLIILTAMHFWQINLWAGVLIVPYIAWVTFTTFLNYEIWRLNC